LKTREVIRKLIRWSALRAGTLVITAALLSLAIHAYGAHRLGNARENFDSRWGHLTQIKPPPSVPDRENSARWLVAGGNAIVCSMEDQKFYSELSGKPTSGWTEVQTERARWILHEQQDALRILLRTGSFDTFNMGYDGFRANYDEIHFLGIVKGLRLLTLEARLAWSEDRIDDSLAALNAVGRATDGLLQTPIVMTWGIGSAATRWACRAAVEIVHDPCAGSPTLEKVRTVLPSQNPDEWGDTTLAVSVAEISEEGLQYTDDFYDPSMGWSIPFWVSNRFLVEDLVVAQILERWSRYLELGREPAASWPPDAAFNTWGSAGWPPWMAMTGTYTPNLLGMRARAQAASTELQQLEVALALRLASPQALGSDACDFVDHTLPTALTGQPLECGYDEDRHAIVIEIPGGKTALRAQVATENQATEIPPIELRVGDFSAGCGRP